MRLFQVPLALVLSVAMPSSAMAIAAPATEGMTPEQKLERAKSLYGEGDTAFKAGEFAAALAKFEEAYNVYAPDFHVFNMNIGLAAYELGDCVKAKTAFQRFLDLVPDNPARGDAQKKILEIERSGCANVAPEPAPPPVVAPVAPPVDDDAPELRSKKSERDEMAERERKTKAEGKVGPLLVSGSVLTGVGAALLIGGGVSVALANDKANELADLATAGPTGFPDGNYSEEEVFDLDRNQLPANNTATVILFAAGGTVAAVGIILLAVHFAKKKGRKRADKNARRNPRARTVQFVPAWMPGGGGAAATVRF